MEFGRVHRGGVFLNGKLLKNGMEDVRFMVLGPAKDRRLTRNRTIVVLSEAKDAAWKVGGVYEVMIDAWPVVE